MPRVRSDLPTRRRLPLGAATLGILRRAAEQALNVPAAKAARAAFGRVAAAATLRGVRTRMVKVKAERDCRVVVQRPVDLTPRTTGRTRRARPGRKSGRSNWPKTKEARAAWYARRALRDAQQQQQQEAATYVDLSRCRAASGVPGDAEAADGEYVPSGEVERRAFLELRSAIAEVAGVEPSRVLAPACVASMAPEGAAPLDARCEGLWWRKPHVGDAWCVALEDGTAAPRLRATLGAGGEPRCTEEEPAGPMRAGDAVVVGSTHWRAPGDGDFLVTVEASIV